MSGWALDRFTSNMEEYVCGICRDVFKNAATINCGHTYCQYCIARSEHNFKNQCPLCRTLITQTVPDFSKRMFINGSIIKCQHHEDGCTFKDATSRIFEHEFICSYRPFPCSLCKDTVPFRSLEYHMENECEKRPVTCKDCHQKIPYFQVENHKNECPELDTTCLNCDWVGKQFAKAQHNSECPNILTECTYKEYGCDHICIRNKLASHIQQVDHLQLVCAYIEEREEHWEQKLAERLQDGPFTVSTHGHSVWLVCDLDEDNKCHVCHQECKLIHTNRFGYKCTKGCAYYLCASCLYKHRTFKSKHTVPNPLLFLSFP